MLRFLSTTLRFLLILALLSGMLSSAQAQASTPLPPLPVRQLFNAMTPEERVGQLFLVTFRGDSLAPETPIYDLITRFHVGGVVLSAANDNFSPPPETLSKARALTTSLQRLEWESANGLLPGIPPSQYIPLFIGITQDGDGPPGDQILSGLSPQPSWLALGATWQPSLAEEAGKVLGEELSRLGFNLYFGPSLDVLSHPSPAGGRDLGTRIFGGDPFWVGEMGKAFVRGLHEGSERRLLVIGKHFPGRGDADRPPESEVATVQKSLEQLKQVELAPFFAVTGNAPNAQSSVDGLLVSHIRYRGLQGNIRATTRPVSFDAQALTQILNLPPFLSWYQNGGLIVSDDLSTRAVRQFYAPGNTPFAPRIVVRDAFLAGNDLLYLGNLQTDTEDPYLTAQSVITFFVQKYREDSVFSAAVDRAVMRILLSKYRLYGRFDTLANVLPEADLETIGTQTSTSFKVAQAAATLISPEKQELSQVFPLPPSADERLIFFTDTIEAAQCSACPPQVLFPVHALEQAILRLYGRENGGQVAASNLKSYPLTDLQLLLESETSPLLDDLRRSDWVILSLASNRPESIELIRRFLGERQDVLRQRRVVLFFFSAPYYLDSTDLSRLTLSFALFGRSTPFIEVAARLLYQELTPQGASPVSIPATGYDLITATSPDPNQVIRLILDLPPSASTPNVITPQPPQYRIGDTIAVRTDVILDHNGHPVPDETVVRFSMLLSQEGGGILEQVEATTRGGIARASFRLERAGRIEIRASSEPALVSEIVQLDVSERAPAVVTVLVPQTVPSTPAPAPTPIVTPRPQSWVREDGRPTLRTWSLSLFWLGILAAGSFWLQRRLDLRYRLRLILYMLVGGLSAYAIGSLLNPRSGSFTTLSGWLVLVTLGAALGLVIRWAGEFFGEK
ncbi:MAG: glycoside hydrolase family 3 N-terminal domain-containing protein [Anaerolineales bacterium]